MSPLPWQPEAIEVLSKAVASGKSALDASDTGVGKTAHALFACKGLGARIGVVCPKVAVPAWQEMAEKVGVGVAFAKNIEALKTGKYGFLERDGKKDWRWRVPDDVLLTFDETHRFAGHNTENGKILASAPRPCLMLSATVADSPIKMRAVGHQLNLTTWNDWLHWCGRNGVKVSPFGMEFEDVGGVMDRLHRQIFHTGRGVRIRKADLPGFPEQQIQTVLVPVEDPEEINDAYVEELLELQREASSGGEWMLRARQISERQKIPALLQMAEDLVDEGNSVVVFVNFRDTLEALAKECPDAGLIYGGQSETDRQGVMARFQRDELRKCFAMLQAGGISISLHDTRGVYPRVSLINPGWSAVEIVQAMGRIHRANGKTKAIQRFLFAEGTVEEEIRDRVQSKADRIETLNDGDLRKT